MAATAHLAAEHFERAEKYFLIAINRWVQSGVGTDFSMTLTRFLHTFYFTERYIYKVQILVCL